MAPPRPSHLSLVKRISDVEYSAFDHETRLERLENTMSSMVQTQKDTLQTSKATHALVLALVPDVTELKKERRALKVTKKGGAYGIVATLAILIENYGPELVKLIANWGN